MNIPVVDLNVFLEGNAEAKNDFVKKLGQAYEEVGFVAVQNHGIDSMLIEAII